MANPDPVLAGLAELLELRTETTHDPELQTVSTAPMREQRNMKAYAAPAKQHTTRSLRAMETDFKKWERKAASRTTHRNELQQGYQSGHEKVLKQLADDRKLLD